jgi:hypothetical protein
MAKITRKAVYNVICLWVLHIYSILYSVYASNLSLYDKGVGLNMPNKCVKVWMCAKTGQLLTLMFMCKENEQQLIYERY